MTTNELRTPREGAKITESIDAMLTVIAVAALLAGLHQHHREHDGHHPAHLPQHHTLA